MLNRKYSKYIINSKSSKVKKKKLNQKFIWNHFYIKVDSFLSLTFIMSNLNTDHNKNLVNTICR